MRFPQPVFASPNFIDCRNDHILGLMWPSARQGLKENALSADPPFKALSGLRLVLDAEIAVVAGRSLDVVVAWVKRHGLPEPGAAALALEDRVRQAHPRFRCEPVARGQGFAPDAFDRGEGVTAVPPAVRRYIAGDIPGGVGATDPTLVASLKRKAEWCDTQPPPKPRNEHPLGRPLTVVMREPQRTAEVAEVALAAPDPGRRFPV